MIPIITHNNIIPEGCIHIEEDNAIYSSYPRGIALRQNKHGYTYNMLTSTVERHSALRCSLLYVLNN